MFSQAILFTDTIGPIMHGHPFAIENVEKARSMFYRYSSRFLTTFFFVFGLTMWSWPLFAQGPAEAEDLQLMKVQGQVYDAETLQPLAGTNVILVKNSVKANQFGVATAKNGTFIFLRVEPGSYKLTIRRIGYEDQIFKNMQVGSAATPKFLRIPLKPTAINADEVIITATRREQTLAAFRATRLRRAGEIVITHRATQAGKRHTRHVGRA